MSPTLVIKKIKAKKSTSVQENQEPSDKALTKQSSTSKLFQ